MADYAPLICPTSHLEGMREFRDVTYPLLLQSGLRDQGV
jgi:hypothetical protein